MVLDPTTWPLVAVVAAFAVSAAVIATAGTRLTHVAEVLAHRTGLGQAMFGSIFLGGTTSLPGIVTSVVAAAQDHPELAVSNAVGGIAAQTVFLVAGDILYRRANLEHAAASLTNVANGVLLVALLAIPLVAMAGPDVAVLAVHPASLLLVAGYLFGVRIASSTHAEPMWAPRRTPETRDEDKPNHSALERAPVLHIWGRFAGLAALVALAGYVVARTGIALAERTGLSETAVGVYLTAIATSLPELVTCVAAVRRGALALAVGDILGGNAFDVLFIAFADVAWRSGSIYHAVTQRQVYFIALTILLTATMLLGMVHREKHGIANIGFESALVLVFYVVASVLIFL